MSVDPMLAAWLSGVEGAPVAEAAPPAPRSLAFDIEAASPPPAAEGQPPSRAARDRALFEGLPAEGTAAPAPAKAAPSPPAERRVAVRAAPAAAAADDDEEEEEADSDDDDDFVEEEEEESEADASLVVRAPVPAAAQSVSRLVAVFSAPDAPPKRRREALERLAGAVAGDAAAAAEALKPALKRFGDPSERCREAAVGVALAALEALPDVVPYLAYVVPVLAYRVAPDSRPEPSERVRELLFDLLRRCLELAASSPGFGTHFHTVAVVLVHGLADRDPEVQAAAARGATLLAAERPTLTRAYSNEMVALVMPLLAHRLARVRLAALGAVRALVPCGAGERVRDLAAFREHNMIDINEFYHGGARANYLALLVVDRNERVRVAFFGMITSWMEGAMQDRFDYETLLVPYVLTGLFDASAAVRGAARGCVAALGREFEADREEELKDEAFYGDEADRAAHGGAAPLLPHFLDARPPLGERRVVSRFVDRLVPAICAELVDWKRDARSNSLALLVVLLAFGEGACTRHLPRLVPALLRVEAEAGREAGRERDLDTAARLLGRHAEREALLATLESAADECEDARAADRFDGRVRAGMV